MTNLDDKAIRVYLRARTISEPVKETLQEVVRRKAQLAELAARREWLTGTMPCCLFLPTRESFCDHPPVFVPG